VLVSIFPWFDYDHEDEDDDEKDFSLSAFPTWRLEVR